MKTTLRETILLDNANWLRTLTEPQVRALACQHGMKTWRINDIDTLIGALGVMPMVTIVREVMDV